MNPVETTLPLVTTEECLHRPPCPGCPRFGESGVDQSLLQQLSELAQASGALLEPLLEGPAQGSRNRSRLAVRGRRGKPRLGLFEERSHKVVEIPTCQIHHPKINEAALALKRAFEELECDFYRDDKGHGLFRYTQFVVHRPSGRVQLTLVVNAKDTRAAQAVANTLEMHEPDLFHSIWMNENQSRNNAIFQENFSLLSGDEWLEEDFAGARLSYHPGSFGQGNLNLAERMTEVIQKRLAESSDILEFHAGVGALGLGLAKSAERYRANELAEQSLMGLRRGIETMGLRNAQVLEGPAINHLSEIASADAVICDPTRKGLEPELLAALIEHRPKRLVTLHCGFGAALRDIGACVAGGMKLQSILPVALFPYGKHVEVVSFFAEA